MVHNAVETVENCMRDAILTAMDNMIIPRIEMAVRSIIRSSGQGPRSVVQHPDQTIFTGNTENTPLRSAYGRRDLNIGHDRNDETCNVQSLEVGELPVLRPNYDWRAHSHHSYVPIRRVCHSRASYYSTSAMIRQSQDVIIHFLKE